MTTEGQNIDVGQRGVRGLISVLSMGAIYAHEGPLGGWVALAFIAVYCVFTAITAWDPFYALYRKIIARFEEPVEFVAPREFVSEADLRPAAEPVRPGPGPGRRPLP